jgi:Spy/CpxP family protein refolding chaperone
MKKALYVLAAAVFVASTIAVAAAHTNTGPGVPPEMQFMHAACASTGTDGQPQSHIAEQFAQTLELTPAQTTDIDRLASEGCATMMRTHQQILDLLTPEQRAKITQMHSDDSMHAHLIEMFKKLHGGK